MTLGGADLLGCNVSSGPHDVKGAVVLLAPDEERASGVQQERGLALADRQGVDVGLVVIEIMRVVVDGKVVESDGKDRECSAHQGPRPVHSHPGTITGRFKGLAAKARLPEIDLRDVRHSYATAGRDAKIDWKALSQRIGHADVAFTMKQYVQADLDTDRQVANALAELIIGGNLASVEKSA
ncbi:hypothetical protein ACIBH1_31825 [Nonomuraea sp. NPDC050663]|uniref:hypothetical protein n=1 Tax=Nonomuraea sp. NPDC050663 TaxID=3364370 RepID=UPI00379DC882